MTIALKLDCSQAPFLHQRLDLLDLYLDIAGKTTGDYFVDGGATILTQPVNPTQPNLLGYP